MLWASFIAGCDVAISFIPLVIVSSAETSDGSQIIARVNATNSFSTFMIILLCSDHVAIGPRAKVSRADSEKCQAVPLMVTPHLTPMYAYTLQPTFPIWSPNLPSIIAEQAISARRESLIVRSRSGRETHHLQQA
jgi:hypothetical protein